MLSNGLQSHFTTLQKADKFVRCTITAMQGLKESTGKHEEQVSQLVKPLME
jgi:hypothetical protein